ncbi:uncharacterized protein LOC143253078 isoform X2 [Tachypleus tridentatus]|uniref:uncharacterized protein LOC143253078 isoform X2 n=1 Tax=Tachypleus tridentatus TaxID=6853 RepID=UPI003FD3753D
MDDLVDKYSDSNYMKKRRIFTSPAARPLFEKYKLSLNVLQKRSNVISIPLSKHQTISKNSCNDFRKEGELLEQSSSVAKFKSCMNTRIVAREKQSINCHQSSGKDNISSREQNNSSKQTQERTSQSTNVLIYETSERQLEKMIDGRKIQNEIPIFSLSSSQYSSGHCLLEAKVEPEELTDENSSPVSPSFSPRAEQSETLLLTEKLLESELSAFKKPSTYSQTPGKNGNAKSNIINKENAEKYVDKGSVESIQWIKKSVSTSSSDSSTLEVSKAYQSPKKKDTYCYNRKYRTYKGNNMSDVHQKNKNHVMDEFHNSVKKNHSKKSSKAHESRHSRIKYSCSKNSKRKHATYEGYNSIWKGSFKAYDYGRHVDSVYHTNIRKKRNKSLAGVTGHVRGRSHTSSSSEKSEESSLSSMDTKNFYKNAHFDYKKFPKSLIMKMEESGLANDCSDMQIDAKSTEETQKVTPVNLDNTGCVSNNNDSTTKEIGKKSEGQRTFHCNDVISEQSDLFTPIFHSFVQSLTGNVNPTQGSQLINKTSSDNSAKQAYEYADRRMCDINISSHQQELMYHKKVELLKFKEECEVYFIVTRMLISKDPQLQAEMSQCLKLTLDDLSSAYMVEFKEFVEELLKNPLHMNFDNFLPSV